MGIRESLNTRSGITATVILVVIVAAIVMTVRQMRGESGEEGLRPQAYFSDDDGKTVFRDDASKLPPFEHKGKQAVWAVVSPAADGSNTILYLQRYTPAGKEMKTNPKPSDLGDPAFRDPALLAETEIKRPGEKEWVKMSDPRAAAIMQPK